MFFSLWHLNWSFFCICWSESESMCCQSLLLSGLAAADAACRTFRTGDGTQVSHGSFDPCFAYGFHHMLFLNTQATNMSRDKPRWLSFQSDTAQNQFAPGIEGKHVVFKRVLGLQVVGSNQSEGIRHPKNNPHLVHISKYGFCLLGCHLVNMDVFVGNLPSKSGRTLNMLAGGPWQDLGSELLLRCGEVLLSWKTIKRNLIGSDVI